MPRCSLFVLTPLLLALTLHAHAEIGSPLAGFQSVGQPDFKDWQGVNAKSGTATLKLPGEADFQYPAGPKGAYGLGFRSMNDGTRDWRDFYGLQFELEVPPGRTCEIEAALNTSEKAKPGEFLDGTKAVTSVSGRAGWQRVTLPWAIFDFSKSRAAFLEFIKNVRLSAKFSDGKDGEVHLKNIRVVRAPAVALEAPVRGQAVQPGETARYNVTLANCTDFPQAVNLSFEKYGFEAMHATVEPAQLQLAPGATATAVVSVTVPKEGIPPGGHESQKLIATGNGDGGTLAKLEFVTARDVPRPCIQLTPQGWDEVREKVKHYKWAKDAQDDYVKAADAWQVPEVSTPEQRRKGPEGHAYVFIQRQFDALPKVAVAWQLTRDKKYAEKVAVFLRRLADEKTGYPSTFACTSMGSPQEGEDFQRIAIAYDAILDSGVLTPEDKRAIDHTFRLFMQTYETELQVGNMGNWSTAAATAGLFCSLSMGDLAAAQRYITGPSGFNDYLSKGIMDDGWWWECSTSYNFWVASELTQCALAMKPWGVDLLNQQVPASYSPLTIITGWALHPPYGISFEKWGPVRRNTRCIKQLWDAVPGVADYRGVAFGMNDGHEEVIGGSRLELAYYAFHDPAYVPLILNSGQRDLIYGVPELPQTDAKPYSKSSYAENLGFALLRSQTEKREPREQIEAVFKIGTQGGYHGHFDRASLNTIMRYGRSFWDPEVIWYGYANFMYKFYVQTSVAHNMVVVDQKQQEAVPSSQLLFHSGKMMQVVAQETNARWSDPPYGGLKPDASSSGGAVATLSARMKQNRESFPLVTDRKWGALGPFSDRVLQRRLGIVTDDYIVVADYLKSKQPHTFDNLFQMKGFADLQAEGKNFLRHDARFNPDPHSAGQFITDCDWYRASAPALSRFVMDFEKSPERSRDHNELGLLKIDLRSLWPRQQEIMIGQAPEVPESTQWVNYELTGDGKTLAKGESGVWILGQMDIDVPVQGINDLQLNVTTDGKAKKNALFLANARIVTNDGKEIPLKDLSSSENVLRPAKAGQDYYGGPIKIAGVSYDSAIPAQPQSSAKPAVLHISLAGKNAARFKATLGGDYPQGDESARQKVYALRSKGTEARFLTVLEPYEDKAMVKSATATSPDTLRVELADGRAQDITIRNLAGTGKDISVEITETKAGQTLRHETTTSNGNNPQAE